MKKRAWFKLVSSLSLLLLLVACGGGGGSTSSPPATSNPSGGTTNPPSGGTTNPPTATVTSADLIDAALANGQLDTDTATLYKFYAAFGDPRLPAAYQGQISGVADNGFLWQTINNFSNFSASTQDALAPFLVPPMYSGSWWDLQQAAGSAASVSPLSAPCDPLREDCPLLSGWAYIKGTHVDVWYQTRYESTDKAKAQALEAEIDGTIWPKETAYMGVSPLPDRGLLVPYEGPDTKLDVALVDLKGALGITYPSFSFKGCGDASTYILLDRSTDIFSTFAHEFMHAIQFAMPVKDCLTADYLTLMESTANWAANYVYPKSQWEHQYTDDYMDNINQSLLEEQPPLRPYGAYMFPLFLTKAVGPDLVKKAWQLAAADSQVQVYQDVVNLDQVWPKFVAQLWNQAPLDDFLKWDDITHQVLYGKKEKDLQLLGRENQEIDTSPGALPGLSGYIYHVTFNDSKVRTAAFFNGFTYKQSYQKLPNIGNIVKASPLTADQRKGAHLQALVKINGQWESKLRDWTNVPYVIFYQDIPGQKVDEILLFFSNSDTDLNRTVQATDIPSHFWLSNISSTSAWQGEAHFTCMANGVKKTFDATNVRYEPNYQPTSPLVEIPDNEISSFPWNSFGKLTSADISYGISGSDGSCSYSGSGSTSLTSSGGFSTLQLYPYARTEPAVQGFTLTGIDTISPIIWSATESCNDGSHNQVEEDNSTFWFSLAPGLSKDAKVSSDGQTMSGTAADVAGYGVDCTQMSGSWSLQSVH